MKKIITTIALGILSLGAFAQQDAGFSMYFFNPVYINPAYAGSRELISGSLVHRSQWVNMPDAPTSQSLSIHSAIPNSRIGLGFQAYNDKIGPMKNSGLSLTFAYHLPVSDDAKLSFGISGMANNISIAINKINIDDKNDPSYTNNSSSSIVTDGSAGLYFYKKRFYAGLSATHLLQTKFGLTDISGANNAKFFRQYYLTSGIVLPINTQVDFRPSILVKYVKAVPALGEVDAAFIFYQKLILGAGFRTGKGINMKGTDNMVIGFLQFHITNYFNVGYSFDYYVNRTGTYNSGTHEVMIGWDISHTKTKMSNPRFF